MASCSAAPGLHVNRPGSHGSSLACHFIMILPELAAWELLPPQKRFLMFKFQEGNVGPGDSTQVQIFLTLNVTEPNVTFSNQSTRTFLFSCTLGGLPTFAHNKFQMVWMAAQEPLKVLRSGFLLTFHYLESFVFHLFSSRTLSLRIVIYVH